MNPKSNKPWWAIILEQRLTDIGINGAEFSRRAGITSSMWCRWMQGQAPTKPEDQRKAVQCLVEMDIPTHDLVSETLTLGGDGAVAMQKLIEEGRVASAARRTKRIPIQEVAMQHQTLRRDTMERYKIKRNPFRRPSSKSEIAISPTLRAFSERVIYGITNTDSIIAVVGRPGSGKTTLKSYICEILKASPHNATIIEPEVFEAGDLNTGALQSCIIQATGSDSSQWAIYKDAQRKGAESLKCLSEKRGDSGMVVLIIDESHRLTRATLDALKVLNDQAYRGFGKLVHIVLFGQPLLPGKIHDPSNDQFEIRTEFMEIPQLEDGWKYVQTRLQASGSSQAEIDSIFPTDTVSAFRAKAESLRCTGMLTPIYMENIFIKAMNYSCDAHRDKVLPAVVEEIQVMEVG